MVILDLFCSYGKERILIEICNFLYCKELSAQIFMHGSIDFVCYFIPPLDYC